VFDPERHPVGKRILIVEDDADTAEMIEAIIAPQDFHTSLVIDRDAAMEEVGRSCPDVILLDLRTEGVPILELIEQTRRCCPQTRIILISATAGLATIAQALGVRFFLQKPFDPQKLLALIDDALKSGEHAAVVTE
jgi:two-component system, OmpR family, response regulator AdeR